MHITDADLDWGVLESPKMAAYSVRKYGSDVR
jgi:hypothetical protein